MVAPALLRGFGVVRVTHGANLAARAVAHLFRLPAAGDAVETRLIVTPAGEGEQWVRTFGARALNTRQYPAADGAVAERFGPLEFRFRREAVPEGTLYRHVGTAFIAGPLRLPLPRWCAPRIVAREDSAGDHRVRIDVRIELPAIGPILSYAGTIAMDEISERAQRCEPRERRAPAKRRTRERAGESEGQSPSDRT